MPRQCAYYVGVLNRFGLTEEALVTSKWEVTAAVLSSKMAAPMRLIMLVLLDAADAEDAVIPERFTPSLTDLVSRTGLGRGTVADRLNDLEGGGWVKRDRPSLAEARAGAKTQYALTIGDPSAGLKPKKEKSPVSTGSSSPGAGLVREEDQSDSRTSPGAGLALVREPDGGSPGAGPDLVREPDGKDTYLPTTSHQDQPRATAAADAAAPLPGFEDIEHASPQKRKTAKKAPKGEPTENQRINTLTKVYTDRVQLSAFHAVRKVVETAVQIGTYSDDQIRAALDRLVAENMTCSMNTMRIELEGPKNTRGHQPYRDQPADAYERGSL
jgi:hypothetical protein